MTDGRTTPAPSQAHPLAGWYPDPATPGQLRYWTGDGWTPHVQDAEAAERLLAARAVPVDAAPSAVPAAPEAPVSDFPPAGTPLPPQVPEAQPATAALEQVAVQPTTIPAVAPLVATPEAGSVAALEAEFALPAASTPVADFGHDALGQPGVVPAPAWAPVQPPAPLVAAPAEPAPPAPTPSPFSQPYLPAASTAAALSVPTTMPVAGPEQAVAAPAPLAVAPPELPVALPVAPPVPAPPAPDPSWTPPAGAVSAPAPESPRALPAAPPGAPVVAAPLAAAAMAAPAAVDPLLAPPATAPLAFDPPAALPSSVVPPVPPVQAGPVDVLPGGGGEPGRRRRGPLLLVGALVLAALAGLAFLLLRPQEDVAPAAASAGTPVETPKAYQTGAAYLKTSAPTTGDLPTCAASGASWKPLPGSQVQVIVTVAGPKLVVVTAIDGTHPERPSLARGTAVLKAPDKGHTFVIPAPPGGVGRVQVAIQGADGIQRCDAAKAG